MSSASPKREAAGNDVRPQRPGSQTRERRFCRVAIAARTGNRSVRALLALLAAVGTLSFAGCRCDPVNCQGARKPLSRNDAPNPIVMENQKPGDASWQLSNPAKEGEIEGYASATSVNRGESISFFVNTSEPFYTLEIFRMGWYGGAGAREMTAPVSLPGVEQPIPQPDPDTGLIECQWTSPYTITVPDNQDDPSDWASGVYLARLTGASSGKQAYIIFVVREDARQSDLLFQSSVNTYEAYNNWGGRSLYSKPRAVKVSFSRPYRKGDGSGDFLRWEYNMVRFLEREGYDVTYSTDVDTHARGIDPLLHNGFLVVGHDEYWSWQMRENVTRARDSGVSLGVFGANACFWQIRYEPSSFTNAQDRTIVCYKSDARGQDPDYMIPGLRHLATVTWRERPVKRPEDELLGVMYDWKLRSPNADMVILDASNWVFEGTGLQNGDHLPGLLGYEADRIFGHCPCDTVVLARSPTQNTNPSEDQTVDQDARNHKARYSHMTLYTTRSCSVVVASGSMQWNWGLDDFAAGHRSLANAAAQQATRNILNRFGARPGSAASSAH